jgi:hypothetical protein
MTEFISVLYLMAQNCTNRYYLLRESSEKMKVIITFKAGTGTEMVQEKKPGQIISCYGPFKMGCEIGQPCQ